MRAVLVFAAACATAAPPPAAPAPTAAAPAAPLARLEASRDLDAVVVGHAGQPTVVMWMASWCGHCRKELAVFDHVRAQHPHVRWLAANYKAHEEYDNRGNSLAIRELAGQTPWLRFVPAGDELFAAFGSPPLIPTIFIYDRRGALVTTFDRRERTPPDETELDALLRTLD